MRSSRALLALTKKSSAFSAASASSMRFFQTPKLLFSTNRGGKDNDNNTLTPDVLYKLEKAANFKLAGKESNNAALNKLEKKVELLRAYNTLAAINHDGELETVVDLREDLKSSQAKLADARILLMHLYKQVQEINIDDQVKARIEEQLNELKSNCINEHRFLTNCMTGKANVIKGEIDRLRDELNKATDQIQQSELRKELNGLTTALYEITIAKKMLEKEDCTTDEYLMDRETKAEIRNKFRI